MTIDLNKRYLGFIAMFLCYGSVIISFFIPKEMKDINDCIMNVSLFIAAIFFGLFFYYNRGKWKRFLFWILLMSGLYLLIMWVSKPMMEAPFEYQPVKQNQIDTH